MKIVVVTIRVSLFYHRQSDSVLAAADDDFHSIVSWSADGLSFSIIHQKDIFIERIVPKYFKMTKFCSFGGTITSSLVFF
jgi:hypothetical protein